MGFRTVSFKDRLMQVIKQIRAVESLLGEKIAHTSPEKKFLKYCVDELRNSQDTLAILHKELKEYVTQ